MAIPTASGQGLSRFWPATAPATAASPPIPPEVSGPQANADEAFVDPYSLQAKQDYLTLLQAVLQRRPDGVLFDYIRYPKGTGSASVASRVQDLWIYGVSAQQALLNRALNQKGAGLIQQYLSQGFM